MEKSQTTLAIDFGAKYIGFALVRNEPSANVPLFAGTLAYEKYSLRKKVEERAQLRRVRRTKKTKKARLRLLIEALTRLNLSPDATTSLMQFCRRRGFHPLFEEKENKRSDKESSKEEIIFHVTREDFFIALEKEIQSIIPEEKGLWSWPDASGY